MGKNKEEKKGKDGERRKYVKLCSLIWYFSFKQYVLSQDFIVAWSFEMHVHAELICYF